MPVRAVASVPSLPPISGPLTASGVSVGTSYEVTTATDPGGAGLLQLKRVKNFPTGRTIAAADSEYGWTWLNRAALTSADDDTTNDGESTWVHSTTNADWFGATRTAPIRYRDVPYAAGQSIDVVCRVKSNTSRNYEFAGIMLFDPVTQTNWSRVIAGYAGGSYIISANDTSGVTATEATTTSTVLVTNGIWLRMVWTDSGWTAYYSTANQSTPPTSWTLLHRRATSSAWGSGTAAGNSVGVGMFSQTVNTTGGFTPRWLYWRADVVGSTLFPTALEWGTELFSTSGSEQLVGEVDFGAAVTLDQTKLRQVLADAVNTRPCDSATVTFSVVGGSSTGPASSTYYAAGSVVVSGPYRYWRVYTKITSATGVEQGSVRLPISLPTSA